MPTRTHETGRVSAIARVKRARGKKSDVKSNLRLESKSEINFRFQSKFQALLCLSNARTIGGIRSEPEGTEEPSARETPDIARCTPAGPLIPLERGALFYVR